MFVADIGSSVVHDAFVSALRIQKVNVKEITQARWIIEPVITKLAARNRTVDNIDSLKANVERAQDLLNKGISAHHENMDFHGLIAEATQNRVLRLSVEALIHSLRDVQGQPKNQLLLDKHALFWHREILKAIEERKPKKAADLMDEHIGEVGKDYGVLIGLD
jgi:GntR family transcriptional repressor for pyruvate dehydrogenase complex